MNEHKERCLNTFLHFILLKMLTVESACVYTFSLLQAATEDILLSDMDLGATQGWVCTELCTRGIDSLGGFLLGKSGVVINADINLTLLQFSDPLMCVFCDGNNFFQQNKEPSSLINMEHGSRCWLGPQILLIALIIWFTFCRMFKKLFWSTGYNLKDIKILLLMCVHENLTRNGLSQY